MSLGETLYTALTERCGDRLDLSSVSACITDVLMEKGYSGEDLTELVKQYVPTVFRTLVYNNGDVEVIKVLGTGSYGKVELIKEKTTGLKFARKTFTGHKNVEGAYFSAVIEIATLGTLRHPNVVPLIASGFYDDGSLYAVLPVADMTLNDFMKKQVNTATFETKKSIMYQIINGMREFQLHHAMHRDLKPDNILMTKDGHVWIADMGLAKLNYQEGRTQYINIQTMWWRAPEVVCGEDRYTDAIDVFSIGCIFAELFRENGSPLFRSDGVDDLVLLMCEKLSTPSEVIDPAYKGEFLNKLPRISGENWKSWGKKLIFTLPASGDPEEDIVKDMIMDMLNIAPSKRPSFDMLSKNMVFAKFPHVVPFDVDYLNLGLASNNTLYPSQKELDNLKRVFTDAGTGFAGNRDINANMTNILEMWILSVMASFRLAPDVINLSILILLKEVCKNHGIKRGELQAYGMMCVSLASKIHNENIPSMHDYKYVSSSVFDEKKLSEIERRIVSTVGLSAMGSPTVYDLAVEMLTQLGWNVNKAPPADSDRLLSFICYVTMLRAFDVDTIVYDRLYNGGSFNVIAEACCDVFLESAILDGTVETGRSKEGAICLDRELVDDVRSAVKIYTTTFPIDAGGYIKGKNMIVDGRVLGQAKKDFSIKPRVTDAEFIEGLPEEVVKMITVPGIGGDSRFFEMSPVSNTFVGSNDVAVSNGGIEMFFEPPPRARGGGGGGN